MRIFTIIGLLVLTSEAFAQVTGPSTGTPGQTVQYTYHDATTYTMFSWSISPGSAGTVTNQQRVGLNYIATIVWSTPATVSVSFIANGTTLSTMTNISVTCPAVTTPNATFSYSNGTNACGSTVISYTTTPPAGLNWYWQTTQTGTSTANSTNSFTVTSGGTYYLRAKCSTTWSTYWPTSAITIKVVPTVTGSNQTICGGSSTSVTLTNNLASTTNTWTVSQSGTSGASNSSGVSGSSSPFTYNLAQTLAATGSSNGTATYTITPSNNGCSGTPLVVTATVKSVPTVAASSQSVFSGQTTSIAISNPNSVSGTTFSWTVVQSNASGASSGSGSSIAQTLTATTSSSGTATYTITPSANSCNGTPVVPVATVFPLPTITAPQTYVVKGAAVTMDAGAGYDTYTWKNSANTTVATTQTYATTTADTYTVTYTKSGASVTRTFVLGNQLSGIAMNYVMTHSVLGKNFTNPATIPGQPVDSVSEQITYFDGLGRAIQNVVTQGSPLKKDLVTPVAYDALGREYRKYLPVAAEANGRYKGGLLDGSGNFAGAGLNFYNNSSDKIADDTRPFSETTFEASPMNRPSTDYGPGSDWYSNGKNIAHQYPTNINGTGTGQEQIICWKVNSSGMPIRETAANLGVTNGYYNTGQLVIKSTIDEQGHEVREYVDKSGHTILKKVQYVNTNPTLNASTDWTQTYYIYDEFGNLRYVLQPELTKYVVGQGSGYVLTTADLGKMAFKYRYDFRKRMIAKQVPGADSVLMVYDNRDRLVMTQDGNQRLNNQWLVTKYDALNRPVITAICAYGSPVSQIGMTNLLSTSIFCEKYDSTATTFHGYTNLVFPTANLTVLTVSYFDNYNFVTDLSLGSAYNFVNNDITGQEASRFRLVVGHPTGSKINVLGTTNYLYSVTSYDQKYRVVQTVTANNKGGTDRTTNLLDFTGRVLKTLTTHVATGHSNQTIARRFIYDHGSRLLQLYHTVNANPEVTLFQNSYNELGQLVDKGLHTGIKQSVDYRYNIRGWLLSMNNSQLTNDGVLNDDATDLYGMELAYNKAFATGTTTGNTVQYNGNISAMKWSLNMAADATKKDQAYNYTYDAINRIASASYLTNTGTWTNTLGTFNESGYAYDQNGNITALTRKDATGSTMDGLTYNYGSSLTGNQLQYVTDSGDATKGFIDGNTSGNDYGYDANGNMVTDKNKGLTATNAIQYNHLNLPTIVTKGSDNIQYTYDATGRKLTQVVNLSGHSWHKTTEYDGEFIYQGDSLQFINHEEGRVVMKVPATPEYQYHLKDHLGNVRLTFTSVTTSQTFAAGFETANQATEATKFLHYPSGAVINTVSSNAHTGSNSQYLNGGTAGQVGVAKSLSVMPGDVVSIQAYAKYNTPSGTATDYSTFIGALLAAFNLSAPVGGETGTPSYGVNYFANWERGSLGDENKGDAMKIFATIIMFDRNYNFLDVAYQAASSSGSLLSATYTAKQPGYAYIYVSNEHPYLTDVYFDDVTITYTPSPVVQQDDYYPFGLTFNSYSRENSVPNRWKFQGQEHVDDLALNWDAFKWRNYQPDIGRFFNVDPLAEKYVYNSVYAFAENKVITFRELEGLEGLHYMEGMEDGTERHVIEKNVTVLLRESKAIPKGADAKTVKKIERQNARIGRDNAANLAGVANDLNQHYNGSDGKGTQNSAGQNVFFKFNVSGIAVGDTKGGSTRDLINLSNANGLTSSEKGLDGKNKIVPSAIITTRPNGGNLGSGVGNFINSNSYSAPPGTTSHEMGHAFLLPDSYTGNDSGYGVMGTPPAPVVSSEVDEIIKNSLKRD